MDSTLLLLIITAVGSTIAAIVSVINIYFTKKKITVQPQDIIHSYVR